MRRLIAAVAMVLAATTAMTPAAFAQRRGNSEYGQHQRALSQAQRECRRDLRRADNRRERIQAQRECNRRIARINREYRRDRRDDRRDWNDGRRDRN